MSDLIARLTACSPLNIALAHEARAEIERLQADLDDTNRIFEMHWDCSMRAIRMWQAANPGNDLVWPDATDLLVWLLDQHKEQRGNIARLRNALDRALAWHDRQGGHGAIPKDLETEMRNALNATEN